MSENTTVSRRGLITATAAAVGGTYLLAPDQPIEITELAWNRGVTANGWPVIDSAPTTRIPGGDLTVNLADGPTAVILTHCVRRFFYEIDDSLQTEELIGHSTNRSITEPLESNHLSGTAVVIRPDWYPLGVTGGFFPGERTIIRDILADCEGTVRWGADLRPAKESHFQIDVAPGDPLLTRVAAKISDWNGRTGVGAGSLNDPTDPTRRSAALRLEDRQRLR